MKGMTLSAPRVVRRIGMQINAWKSLEKKQENQ
jgi:hypothetical protein